ncbi:TetR/AcrR family transcriptional regulator [Sutcliffiella horikoshii]|uniref:TetR/AcrR family transcriptional regulator n=1 Tax=Sutcliffiella horikoshii TaxID=79883 RepID=A0AA94WPV6_9BACI|nr:TetR/AcrR family transcriptional regulator [Sutcliffiella horikoshii]TYS59890.1 TetR/AcrR family transcriptional regulator [Sutcliffiella horikoshii]
MSKKQQIMEKATELFAKQGFEATSIQQITEQCGISKGSFYLSFKSKDELIMEMLDHFFMEVTAETDQLVNSNKNDANLLFKFYKLMFHFFAKHADFAKVLIKEMPHSLNQELLIKSRTYDIQTSKNILDMVESIYGDKVQATKFDLVYCIKGFLRIYSELFLFYEVELDMDLLCQSLVEKTDSLAKHSNIPFITEELEFYLKNADKIGDSDSKEDVLALMDRFAGDMEDVVVRESLQMLREDIMEPSLPLAVRKGLIENVRVRADGKWLALVLDRWFEGGF